jgi:hypothetical protein
VLAMTRQVLMLSDTENKMTRAKDLKRGDVVRLHVYTEVIAVAPSAEGKRTKVVLALEHQGQRRQRGTLVERANGDALEFTDDGYLVKFICKPGRAFHVYNDYNGGDDDEGDEPDFPLPPDDGVKKELV